MFWSRTGTPVLLFGGLGLGPLREFLAPQFPDWRGLGQLIATLGDRFDYPQMYAGIFFVILVSVAFFWITERLEQWLVSSM